MRKSAENGAEQPLATVPSEYPVFKRDDEIDLMELLSVLFKHKKLIAISFFVFAICAFIIASFLPQKWSSEAVIISPQQKEIAEIYEVNARLGALNIENKLDASEIFKRFSEAFRSRVLQQEFLEKTDYYKELLAKKGIKADSEEALFLLQDLADKNVIFEDTTNNKSANFNEVILTFQANSQASSYKLLVDYLAFLQNRLHDDIVNGYKSLVSRKLTFTREGYAQDLLKLESVHDVKIERLKRSLQMAKMAGVKKPITSNALNIVDDPDYPIALGVDALKEKLVIEEKPQNYHEIDANLREKFNYIKGLERFDLDKLDFQPFKYVQKPTMPKAKDSPKRGLITIMAGIFGLIGSCLYILANHAIRSRNEEDIAK